MLVNHFAEHFGGGVFVNRQETLVVGNERRDDGVIFMQQKVMIQMLVDESFHRIADIGKVADHALFIEIFALDGDTGFYAVAVQIAAFAGMVHQAMAVTKINFFRDDVHAAMFFVPVDE